MFFNVFEISKWNGIDDIMYRQTSSFFVTSLTKKSKPVYFNFVYWKRYNTNIYKPLGFLFVEYCYQDYYLCECIFCRVHVRHFLFLYWMQTIVILFNVFKIRKCIYIYIEIFSYYFYSNLGFHCKMYKKESVHRKVKIVQQNV